jgi:OOP family OmpA-OmpF porin
MFKKLIAAAALTLLASSSFAAEPGTFYAGLDVGRSDLDLAGSATSFGGIFGYNISRHWAVEGAVRNAGKFDAFGSDIKVTQTSLSGVGTVFIGKGFDFFGRVGINHLSTDNNSRFVTTDDKNVGINAGAGFAYHFTPAVAARIEAQFAATDLTIVTAGVVFTF